MHLARKFTFQMENSNPNTMRMNIAGQFVCIHHLVMSNSLQPYGLSMEFSRQEYWSGLQMEMVWSV